MKMKRVIRVVAVCAMVLALGVGPAPAQQKVIKIGALYPLTGNLAATGMDSNVAWTWRLDYRQQVQLSPFALGVPKLGGAKIKVVYADTKGEPRNGLAEAERLITQEKVVALIGAYQSAVTKTASPAAERLKVPYVCRTPPRPL